MIYKLTVRTIVLFILLSFSVQSFAQDKQDPVFLPKGGVDGAALIGPPAQIGTPEFKTQMAIVLWLQQTRTPEQELFVQTSLNLGRFTPIISAELLKVDGIELRDTLARIINEVRTDYDAVKATYDLPRPFVVNDQVKPATDARPVASYPSGHAIRAIVYARILSELFPDKKDALTELGLQIGYGRAIAGVHYPMDVIAGQKLGNAYADVIIRQDAFKQAVAKIKGN